LRGLQTGFPKFGTTSPYLLMVGLSVVYRFNSLSKSMFCIAILKTNPLFGGTSIRAHLCARINQYILGRIIDMAMKVFTPEFMATGRVVPAGLSKYQYGVIGTPRLYLECRASAGSLDTWYLRLDGPNGLQHTRLGTINDLNLAQACKLANQLKSEHRNRQKVEAKAATIDVQEQMTLERFFHDIYMPQAKIHKRSFNKDESLFRVRIGPKFGHKLLSEISRREVQAFHHALLAEGLSPATCNHHVVLLRRFLSVALSLDMVQKNVLRGIPLMPVDNLRDVFLTPEQTTRFVEVLTTDANRSVCMALLFMLNTASRKMETLKAKWSDIDLENQLWYIPAVNNKSKRPKTLPLSSGAIQILMLLDSRGKSEYVFPSPESGRPYTTIARVFWRLRAKAGLPENFRVHDLRSSFSARYLGAGGSIFSLQKLLGHSDVRTTATHYARLSAKSLLEAANIGAVAMPQLQATAG
jgi:integrase